LETISQLQVIFPILKCTASHCHTILLGHYPFLLCEQHCSQNKHHNELQCVRGKEVKSTPLRGDDPRLIESRKGKARAVKPSYPNDNPNLDASTLLDESSIPPPTCDTHRPDMLCSIKWCQMLPPFLQSCDPSCWDEPLRNFFIDRSTQVLVSTATLT
jgi:hypothetical protein